jgi:peptidoglycan/LPS O-acetylase OafA/YrhL
MRPLKEQQHLDLLTSMRFFAASEVVVFHHRHFLQLDSDFLLGLASAGYQSVTFFFVLSGFILTFVYSQSPGKYFLKVPAQSFWKARFARIFPAYVIGLILFLPDFINRGVFWHIIPVRDFLLGITLVPTFLQAWWPPTTFLWNGPAWSLSVEVLFYVAFPILSYWTNFISRTQLVLAAYCLALIVNVAPSISVSMFPVSEFWNTLVLYFPVVHLPQFIFGIALGKIYLDIKPFPPIIYAMMATAGILFLTLLFGFRNQLPFWIQTNITLLPLYGLVIFGGAGSNSIFRMFTNSHLLLLGESSYAMYILHMPISFWWLWSTNQANMKFSGTVSFMIYFALVVVISISTFLFVEKPMRKWILKTC